MSLYRITVEIINYYRTRGNYFVIKNGNYGLVPTLALFENNLLNNITFRVGFKSTVITNYPCQQNGYHACMDTFNFLVYTGYLRY